MSNKSIKAYIQALSKSKGYKRQICDVLNERGNQSTGEIEFHTGQHYSTLTARLSDLWDEGLIVPLNDSHDLRYSTWRLTTIDEQPYVIKRREQGRYIKWLKKGLEYENQIPVQFQEWIKNELGI